MKKHHWIYVGLGTLALCVFVALGCTVQPMNYRSCIKLHSHVAVSAILQIGAMFGAGWIGVEVARSTRKSWAGWLAGIAAVLLFLFALFYAGFPGPGNDE